MRSHTPEILVPFPLRIVSWNVLAEDFFRKYAAHYPGVALDAETRRARVVAEVVRLAAEADVIVLQEVDADLVAALAGAGVKIKFLPRAPGKPDGLAWWTATAREPERVVGARFQVHDRRGYRLARSWVKLDFNLEGQRLAVVGTHLDPDLGEALGAAQARELLALLADAPSDVAVVLGDLNGDAHETACQTFAAHGFLAALPTDGGTPATAVLHDGTDWRPRVLDAILVRGADAVLDAVPLPNGPIPSPAHPSDHLPLRASLTIGR